MHLTTIIPTAMSLHHPRDAIAFDTLPSTNASDVIINGLHFNRTALALFNYTYYTNHTLSNASRCYLIFDHFKPALFANGSWANATSCYIPYYGIGARGQASIAFGVAFGVSIMFTLINLRKHGKLYLREGKRFRVIGRRWQWYWMLFVAACAMISCFTGVDVDRYYLQQIPIMLQCFFFVLMVPAALAMVWECTRHWGSWQERQIVENEDRVFRDDDRRAKVEFYLPLVFYAFAWLTFFMTIPRSWTPLQKQHTPEQKDTIARPAATGPREKAGAVLAVFAFVVICYSLSHSTKHYKPRRTRLLYLLEIPLKIHLALILLAIRLTYNLAAAWLWNISLFNADVAVAWPYGFGYAPILAIIIVFEVAGFAEENEDKCIIAQRRARGEIEDRVLGIVKKPGWWSRDWANRYQSDEQRLRNMTAEAPTSRTPADRTTSRPAERSAGESEDIELDHMSAGVRNRSRNRPPTDDPFRDPSPASFGAGATSSAARTERDDASTRTGLTGNTLTAESAAAMPTQRVRSMLDI